MPFLYVPSPVQGWLYYSKEPMLSKLVEFSRQPAAKKPQAEHRADLKLYDAEKRSLEIVDVSVVHPSATNGGDVPGGAAVHTEKEKKDFYSSEWRWTASVSVTPFVIETGGRWAPEAIAFAQKISRMQSGVPYSVFYRRFVERVSVALQRGNARAMLYLLKQAGATSGIH